MSPKALIVLFTLIGSTIGSSIPMLWGGGGFFSMWSLLFSTVGAICGVYVGYKLSHQ